MTRPASIVRFEQIYLAYWLVGIVNAAISWERNAQMVRASGLDAALPGYQWWTIGIGLLIPLILWFFIARRGSAIAKWVLVVFLGIGILSMVAIVAMGRFEMGLPGGLTVVAMLLQATAVWMLFRPDTHEWFGEVDVPEVPEP
jgi:hypothetical protein